MSVIAILGTGPGMVLEKAVEATSRLRGGWVLHPRGRTVRATVEAWGLLDTGRYDAVARLSKATPTPRGWPDVLGLAVRILDGAGAGRPVDLLMSSTGTAPVLRHVLLPRFRADHPYTSILALRDDHGRRRYLAALPRRDGDFLLAEAGVRSAWRPWGRLSLTGEELAAPRFDPVGHLPPGRYAHGLIQHLRARAYPASQRARS